MLLALESLDTIFGIRKSNRISNNFVRSVYLRSCALWLYSDPRDEALVRLIKI